MGDHMDAKRESVFTLTLKQNEAQELFNTLDQTCIEIKEGSFLQKLFLYLADNL